MSKIHSYNTVDNSDIFAEQSFEAIVIFNSELQCINANKACTKVFQYSREEIIGTNALFLVPEESQPVLIEKAKKGVTEPYAIELKRKDGSRFTAMIQGNNVEVNGESVRITTVRDVTRLKKMERDLQSKSSKLASIYTNQLTGIVIIDKSRTITQANQKAAELVGYEKAEEVIGLPLSQLHADKEKLNKFNQLYDMEISKDAVLRDEFPFYRKDGSIVWLRVSGSPINDSDSPNTDDGIIWVVYEINDLKQAEEEREQAFAELEIIFNSASVGIQVVSADRKVIKANQTFVDIVGYHKPEDVIGMSTSSFHVSERLYREFGEKYYKDLKFSAVKSVDYPMRRSDGSTIWVVVSGRALDTKRPADLSKGIVWVYNDITERKRMEQEMLKLTREDALTGVSNRRYFVEQANREISIMKRYGPPLSLLMLDIDFFKRINDEYGHATGDSALIYFANQCKKTVREGDIVGRLGGEEFAIVLLNADLTEAKETGERILTELAQGTREETVPALTASVGAVEIQLSETLESALGRADELLYKAKRYGKNRVES